MDLLTNSSKNVKNLPLLRAKAKIKNVNRQLPPGESICPVLAMVLV